MPNNIFKKSVFTILLGIILTLNSLPLIVLAAPDSGTTNGVVDIANPTEDQLLPTFSYTNKSTGEDATDATKISAVNALTFGNASWQQTLTAIIQMLLNITGALTLIAMTAGGVFMITANGSSEMLDKGKKIVLYSIMGLIVIAVSYAVVIGVSELQFFTPGVPSTGAPGAPGGAPTSPQPDSGSGPAAGAL